MVMKPCGASGVLPSTTTRCSHLLPQQRFLTQAPDAHQPFLAIVTTDEVRESLVIRKEKMASLFNKFQKVNESLASVCFDLRRTFTLSGTIYNTGSEESLCL